MNVGHAFARGFCPALVVAAMLYSPSTRAGDDIVQESFNIGLSIQPVSPIGQTFTPTSPGYSRFGATFTDCNQGSGPPQLTFSLYEGSGFGGTLLRTETITGPIGAGPFPVYAEMDVSGIVFDPGQTYSVRVASASVRWCIWENNLTQSGPGPDYAGGAIVHSGVVQPARGDLRFHLRGVAVADAALALPVVSANPTPAFETVQIDVDVTNAGPNVASDVTVTHGLAGPTLDIVSLTATQGSCASPSCSLGTLARSQTATVSLLVRPTQTGTLTDAITVTATEDGSTGNNSRMVSVVVSDPLPSFVFALPYNFNGMVHAGEAGAPDAATGFRSIADRALSVTGAGGDLADTASPLSGITYDVIEAAQTLDIVHLGNRNTVTAGVWAFDATPDGDDVGIQPTWLADPQQDPVTIAVVPRVVLGPTSRLGILHQASDGGGTFDVTLGFADGASTVATASGPDWYALAGGTPPGCSGNPCPGVALEQNLGSYNGTGDVDDGVPSDPLFVTETVFSAAELLSDNGFDVTGRLLTSITLSNRSAPDSGVAVLAISAVAKTDSVFGDGFE